jgi:hypothetical protein
MKGRRNNVIPALHMHDTQFAVKLCAEKSVTFPA